jgi:hypothetical protein
MKTMTRSRFAALGVLVLGVALAAAPASAQIIELGATTTPIAVPSCPTGVTKANCTIILTETTAIETLADGIAYPTTVKQAGRIVAYTVGLAKLSMSDITGLNARYGGTSQVMITVLKPGKSRFYTVVAQSPMQHAEPYFGNVVQFPLTTTLPVLPGEVVALTVPTWAPVLSIGLPNKSFQYRASRASGCTNFNFQTAQLTIGDATQYRCFYVGTRVEYSVTEVTNPVVPKTVVKSRRLATRRLQRRR